MPLWNSKEDYERFNRIAYEGWVKCRNELMKQRLEKLLASPKCSALLRALMLGSCGKLANMDTRQAIDEIDALLRWERIPVEAHPALTAVRDYLKSVFKKFADLQGQQENIPSIGRGPTWESVWKFLGRRAPRQQEEPTSDEHPLHAGCVLIDGQKRELRRFGDYSANNGGFRCPFCHCSESLFPERDMCRDCRSIRYDNMMVDRDHEVWLSPPPAPVKEPEDGWEVEKVEQPPIVAVYDDQSKLCLTCRKTYCEHANQIAESAEAGFYRVTRKQQQGAH